MEILEEAVFELVKSDRVVQTPFNLGQLAHLVFLQISKAFS